MPLTDITKNIRIVVLIGVVATITNVYAGCEPFLGEPVECINFINYNVFIMENHTQEEIANELLKTIEMDLLVRNNTGTCSLSTLRYICGVYFPECAYEQGPVPMGSPLCRNLCELTIRTECLDLLNDASVVVPNCTALASEDTSTFLFPTKEDPWQLQWTARFATSTVQNGSSEIVSDVVSLPCFEPFNAAYISVDCPPHYSAVKMTGNNTSTIKNNYPCERTCPEEILSSSDYTLLWVLSFVTAAPLVLAGFFSFIPWIASNKLRNFPSIISAFQLFPTIPLGMAFLVGVFTGGYDDVICSNNTNLSDQNDTACGVSGGLLYTGLSLAASWWFCSTLSLFLRSINVLKYKPLLWHIVFHAIGWSPVLLINILLAANKVGTIQYYPFCFIDQQEDEGCWIYAFFFIPLTILLVLGLLLMFSSSVVFTIRHERLKHFKKTWRDYAFSMAYFLFFFQLVIYGWSVLGIQDKVDKGIDDWYECLLREHLAGNDANKVCSIEDGIPLGVLIYVELLLIIAPWIPILLYGLRSHTLSWWKKFCIGSAKATKDITLWLLQKVKILLYNWPKKLCSKYIGRGGQDKDISALEKMISSTSSEEEKYTTSITVSSSDIADE